jgi:hypothetical protein
MQRKKRKHPVFGEIKWEYEAWFGKVRIDYFARFDNLAVAPQPTSKPRKEWRVFELAIHDVSGDGPLQSQIEAFKYLISNELAISQAVSHAILEYYSANCEEWRSARRPLSKSFTEKTVPRVLTLEKLKRLVCLLDVHVHESSKDGFSFVGFGFECSWDEEHGVGVLTHKGAIVDVGQMDIAYRPFLL